MKAGAPFFVRPLVNIIADRVLGSFVIPTLKKHLTFLEDQLTTSAGDYLCGANLTAADILISYGVMAFDPRVDELTTFEGGGTWRETFPKTAAYVDRLKNEEGFKKSKQRIKEIEGK
jgi:glutathione S-transferase